MKQIQEPARTIPVMAETDVLVVGGGPGGLAAALAVAREGVPTMLVERYGSFGGNITQAHVASIAWYRYDQTVEAGGIGVEFEVQLTDALTAIRLLMPVLPALLLTAASVVAWFYPLTRQHHAEILNELARRRGAE